MNRKRTNSLVAIFNILAVATFYIFVFSANYLMSSMMTGGGGGKSVYGNFVLDIFLNKIQIIMPIIEIGVGVFNIICAIQNRENKKICFWQLVFSICYLYAGIGILISFTNIDEDITDWISKIIFSIVPIIFAIINFIRIKKNRPKVIQVISYVAVIILSILHLIGIIGEYWRIIAIVMQLIYIHFQDKYIEESKARKILNIILYYILYALLSVGIFLAFILSLLTTKINDDKWKNSLSELYNNISTLNGATTKELYIPVEKNYKFGFITENGNEKIPCEYDRVSYFNEIEINGSNYYVALAKKDNKYYILSKSNNNIEIDNSLTKYLNNIDGFIGTQMLESFNKDKDYRLAYLQSFEFFFQVFTRGEMKLSQQVVEKNNYGTGHEVELSERNSKYTYKTANYSMLIEPIYDGTEEENDYYDNYNSNSYYYDKKEDMYHISSYETKYKVTVTKPNEELQSSIVYLPGIDTDDATIETFTDGYIEFKTEDEKKIGWYDSSGNQISIPSCYEIKDIKNGKIILQVNNNDDDENYNENEKYEMNFIVIDMSGNTLLQTTAIDVYENMYLVKNKNKNMVLLDNDLNQISNEYDKIITTMQMDISANYSSYY